MMEGWKRRYTHYRLVGVLPYSSLPFLETFSPFDTPYYQFLLLRIPLCQVSMREREREREMVFLLKVEYFSIGLQY